MKYETVILIDDDHIIRYSFKRLIKEFFASQDILTFQHGGDALEYLTNIDFNQFDKKILILLDLNMPLIDGWSFLEKFKEKILTYGDIFTIHILSSTIDRNDIDNINRNTLISGHIRKPLTLEELKELIG
jgi:CheY-like chemotaxis protein